VLSEREYERYLARWLAAADAAQRDAYGPGAVGLYGIGCPRVAAPYAPSCEEMFSVIFSAIPSWPAGPASRQVLAFTARRSAGGDAFLVEGLAAGPLREADLRAVLRGGSRQVFWPDGFPPFGEFYPTVAGARG
jgi:hypothetical protein